MTNPFISNRFGVVTGSSSDIRFPTGTCELVRFKAHPSNIGTFFVGDQPGQTLFPIDAGDDTGWVNLKNINELIYRNPSGSADYLYWWLQLEEFIMADPEQRYSSNESLDRILRLLKGDTVSEAPESLPPPKRSEDESLSMIAELLAGTLESENAVSPLAEYGGVYTKTSTQVYALTSGSATQLNSLSSNMENSDNISSAAGVLTINRVGKYQVAYAFAVQGAAAVEYQITPYWNITAQPQLDSRVRVTATGTAQLVAGVGILDVTVIGKTLDFRASSIVDQAHFTVRDGQAMIHRID